VWRDDVERQVWRDSREKQQGETAAKYNLERQFRDTILERQWERQQEEREREENKFGK
jgi:hypothetical protein